MAVITVTPESPVAIKDACRVDVTENDVNTGASDTDKYPVQDELRCYLAFTKGGVEYGRSYIFSGASHTFPNYHFPSDGAWTVALKDASDDGDIATQAVTVQA
jgi:hypothetical protein